MDGYEKIAMQMIFAAKRKRDHHLILIEEANLKAKIKQNIEMKK